MKHGVIIVSIQNTFLPEPLSKFNTQLKGLYQNFLYLLQLLPPPTPLLRFQLNQQMVFHFGPATILDHSQSFLRERKPRDHHFSSLTWLNHGCSHQANSSAEDHRNPKKQGKLRKGYNTQPLEYLSHPHHSFQGLSKMIVFSYFGI